MRLSYIGVEFDCLLELLYSFAVLLQLEIGVAEIQVNFG